MVAASRVKTNWLLLDDLEFWDEFTTKAITDPDTEDYFKQIDQAIDDKLAETIKWLDSDEAKEYFQQEAEYQEEVFEALEDKWDDILSGEIASADELLDRIYEHGKQQGYNDIRERIRYTDADRQALQFAKDYNFHLIQKLDDNLREAVKNRVIQAVASGEHPYELAPKIQELGVQPLPGSTLSARHRAVMIARTETARVQNTGIIQSYVNEGFTEVNILTAEDSSVCRLCLANAYEFNTDEIILENRGADRTHKIADMNSNSWVPLHPNCRCTYIVVLETREEPADSQVVNLTPLSNDELNILRNLFSNGKLNNEKDLWEYDYKGIRSSLSKGEFEKRLSGFMDSKTISVLTEDLFNFQKNVHFINIEHGWARTNKRTVSGIFSNGANKEVALSADFLEIAKKDKGILYLIHNHPKSNPPLPSPEDLAYFTSLEIKYGLVTNEEGTFILKNNKSSQNKDKYKEIYELGVKIEKEMKKNFSTDTGIIPPSTLYEGKPVKEYTSEELKYFKERDKYVNEHKNKYKKLYEDELSDYGFEIEFLY